MTPADRAELRKLAQAATSGDWTKDSLTYSDGCAYVRRNPAGPELGHSGETIAGGLSHADAAFIAAADPATVLGLLDRIDELEAGETRTEWRVRFGDRTFRDTRSGCRSFLDGLNKAEWPDARLESRTVTTGRWEVVG